MSGVTSAGLSIKTLEEIKAEIESDLLTNVDPSLDTSPQTPIGQIIDTVSRQVAQVWELGQTAYNGFNRRAAEGALLDNIGDLTGTAREEATKTVVACTVNLDAATTLPAGSVANVSGSPALRFVSQVDVTSTVAGNYAVKFEAEEAGPTVVNAGTLSVITAPVLGWNSVTNATDGAVGHLIEEDPAYVLRQEDELTAGGGSTVDAMRADLLKVDGVEEAFVFENTSLVTDGDGVPGKAIECVIFDGVGVNADNNEVAQAIWDSKAGGIETYGNSNYDATDTQGVLRQVYFSRAAIMNVYLTYTLTVITSKYPVDGDAQVKAAVLAKGREFLTLGTDVIALVMKSAALTVAGVIDVTDLRLGFTVTPAGTANLTITSRQIALLDSTRIVITTNPGTL